MQLADINHTNAMMTLTLGFVLVQLIASPSGFRELALIYPSKINI
jgi:hypothetical protein